MVRAIPVVGSLSSSHGENERTRGQGRFGDADTRTSAVHPPVPVNICVAPW